MEGLLYFSLFLPAAISAVPIQESPVTCQSNYTECNPFGDDLIGNFAGIETIQVGANELRVERI